MKTIIVFAIVLVTSTMLFSQDIGSSPAINWIKQAGGDGMDVGRAITRDSIGNVYVTGFFSGTIGFGNYSYTSIGGSDAFVAKFNTTGTLIWFRQISGQQQTQVKGQGICLDGQLNVYVTGFFNSPEISLGDSTFMRTGVEDLFVAKYDNQGNFLSALSYGAANVIHEGYKIATDMAGNIYILSGGNNLSNAGCPYLIRFDSNDSMRWIISNGAFFKDLRVKNFQIFVAGYLNAETDFSGTVLSGSASQYSPFIAKCDTSGIFILAKSALSSGTGNNYNMAHTLMVDDDNNIYIAGRFRQTLVADTLVLSGGNTRYLPYLIKYSAEGNALWARQAEFVHVNYTSNYANQVYLATGNSGSIILCCELLYDIIAFEQIQVGGSGWCFAKFESNGNLGWVTKKELSFNSIIGGNKLVIAGTQSGNIIVVQMDLNLETDWTAFSIGNSGKLNVINLETDETGHIFTYAYAEVPTDVFGPVTGVFVAKLDQSGQVIWTVPLEGANVNTGYGEYLSLDLDGNLILMAHFDNNLTIGNHSLGNPGQNQAIALAKIDANGNVLWLELAGTGQCTGYSVTTDYDNNVIASGIFISNFTLGPYSFFAPEGSQGFLAKYNSSGELIWAKKAGSDDPDGSVFITFVSTDSLNNIYLTGEFTTRNNLIDGYPLVLDQFDGDVILAKFSAEGIIQWAFAYGGDPTGGESNRFWCWPTAIKTSAAGDSYIYGWASKGSYFGPYFLESPENINFFLTKISNTGQVYWANLLQETGQGWHSMQIDIDDNGNVYVGGYLKNSISFENNLVTNQGNCDLFIARFSPSGNFDWAKIFGSNPLNLSSAYNQSNNLWGLSVYDSANILIGGNFQNHLQMDTTLLYGSNVNGFIALIGSGIPPGNYISIALPTLNSCDTNIVVPINVSTLDNIGSVSLTLNFDPQSLTYTGYQNLDTAFQNGTFLINDSTGVLRIAWFSLIPAHMEQGVMLELLFTGIPGNSTISWNTQSSDACMITDINNQLIPAQFVNGAVTVKACPDLSGYVTYDNISLSPMNNTELLLKRNGTVISQLSTDTNGYYNFPDLEYGTYTLSPFTTKPWGGCNAADALMIMRHFVGMINLTGLRKTAADVDLSSSINSADALITANRFVGLITTFPGGDYVYDTVPITMNSPNNVMNNFKGLCYGDVNGSFYPQARTKPLTTLYTKSLITVRTNETFEIPVRLSRPAEIGSLSLGLSYPAENFIIDSVLIAADDPGGILISYDQGSVLKIAWYSLISWLVNDDVLFSLRCHMKNPSNFHNPCLTLEPYSSITDAEAIELTDIGIIIPEINTEGESPFDVIIYPNPFETSASIDMEIPQEGEVKISLFNILGEQISGFERILVSEGIHHLSLEGTNLPTGIYFCKFDYHTFNTRIIRTERLVKFNNN